MGGCILPHCWPPVWPQGPGPPWTTDLGRTHSPSPALANGRDVCARATLTCVAPVCQDQGQFFWRRGVVGDGGATGLSLSSATKSVESPGSPRPVSGSVDSRSWGSPRSPKERRLCDLRWAGRWGGVSALVWGFGLSRTPGRGWNSDGPRPGCVACRESSVVPGPCWGSLGRASLRHTLSGESLEMHSDTCSRWGHSADSSSASGTLCRVPGSGWPSCISSCPAVAWSGLFSVPADGSLRP